MKQMRKQKVHCWRLPCLKTNQSTCLVCEVEVRVKANRNVSSHSVWKECCSAHFVHVFRYAGISVYQQIWRCNNMMQYFFEIYIRLLNDFVFAQYAIGPIGWLCLQGWVQVRLQSSLWEWFWLVQPHFGLPIDVAPPCREAPRQSISETWNLIQSLRLNFQQAKTSNMEFMTLPSWCIASKSNQRVWIYTVYNKKATRSRLDPWRPQLSEQTTRTSTTRRLEEL